MRYRWTKTAVALTAGLLAGGLFCEHASADELYQLGEYLSGDCTACHQLKSRAAGIPPIFGWPVEAFVMVMVAYKEGEREHALMQSVARRLSDEDINALAVFFGKQGK
jgi:cytochrome c553